MGDRQADSEHLQLDPKTIRRMIAAPKASSRLAESAREASAWTASPCWNSTA
jgi:hypothetical protein